MTWKARPASFYSFSTKATNHHHHDGTEPTSMSVPKPWENPKILSSGDYTEESWVEDPTTPLYQYQSQLPRLPVPTLQDTAARFLSTALPLAKSETEAKNLQIALEKFPAQASVLQDRLLQRAQVWNEEKNSSWLQQWWNQMGYLDVRDSVVINVSYYFAFSDDPSATTMIQRGAAILTAVAKFRKGIVSKQRPADVIIGSGGGGAKPTTTTTQPLCSTPYKYMFHACRIPLPSRDQVVVYDPAQYTHAVVAVRGNFFAIDFIDDRTHEPLSLATIEAALNKCVVLATHNTNHIGSIGVCTAMNRDDWAVARATLIQYHQEALEKLESGAVLVCLDIDEEPVTKVEMAKLLLHGKHGYNRWYDKSIQLIVTKNGKAGLMGEHSMMDGMPVVQLADAITKLKYSDIIAIAPGDYPNVSDIFTRPYLYNMEAHIRRATYSYNHLTLENDLSVCRFDGYGSSFMKKAGYSPDAYAQMVMQIATYRLWNGEQVGTYESTQVRSFLHGRTETTRSVSYESAELCRLFGTQPDGNEHDKEIRLRKIQALDAACRAHVQYLKLAGRGQGIDRHFFGLSCCVEPNETLPDLYHDPVFQRSKRWRVSTSHLTHPKFESWGYGQVVPDGVGLAYSVHPRHCVFTITALSQNEGWTEKLSTHLEETLLELRTLIEMEELEKETLKSRL